MIRNTVKISSLLLVIFISTTGIQAQKMSVGYIYPAGAERGTTAEIVVGGLNVNKATAIIVSGKGVKAEIIKPTEEEQTSLKKKKFRKLDDQSSPQLADQLNIRITIDKNAEPGLRDLRLQSPVGISNKLNFEVGQYPNVLENKGSTPKNPNPVEKLPAVLCGQILPGETDYFSFKAEKGIMLVASVKARALVPFIADAVPGWFQSVISLKNSKGKEVAYCDDFRYNVDPTIMLRVPENDTYTLSIHDAIYRGREDFTYRIELGEIPFVQSVFPAAAKVGKKTELTFTGVNLKSNKLSFKPENEGYNSVSTLGNNGEISNSVPFWAVSKTANLLLNDKKNLQITDKQLIFDTLDLKNRSKQYLYLADANETVTFEVMARRIGSLLDGRLRLFDEFGKLLAEADDLEDDMQGLMTFHADPQLTYTFKVPGRYYLQVEDVLDNRGSDYFFVLEKKKATLPFEVFVSPATLSVPRGGTSIFTVTINSKEKLNNPIELNLSGLPFATKLSNLKIFSGAKKKEVSVTIPEGSREGNYELKLTASLFDPKNQSDGKSLNAVAADEMMQAFYYHHNIPAAGFSLEVTPKAAFRIEFPGHLYNGSEYQISLAEGDTTISIPARIKRNPDFKETIELSVYPKNRNTVMDAVKVLPGETEKTLTISVRSRDMLKQRKLRYGIAIVGTVSAEIDKRGKRTIENAAYREMSPLLIITGN
ncbi:MAG: hypothetical protein WCG08_00310 [Paludibacter sp.]